jgi:hypothetical protein
VSALLRRVDAAGGFGAVLHRGDEMGGIILVHCAEKGQFYGLFERLTDLDGRQKLVRCGPDASDQDIEYINYISKRKRSDPDLWLVELNVAGAQQLAAETLCMN